jgi:DHA1 family inner membrane transport protein
MTIEQSYPTRRLNSRLAILAVGLFVVGTNAFVIAGLLPSIASALHARVGDVSYSITYYSVVVAVASPAISILFPRLSRTTLMSIGLVLIAGGTILAAEAPTLAVFTAGRIVAALGGAALVPAATAAAAALAPPERRGRAIAFVAVGFTAATAFGAPLGTAIAALGNWRIPFYALAILAALVAVAVALRVRDVPLGSAVSIRRRFATLGNHRILFALAATVLVVSGFNVVYIFSSAVAGAVTAGSQTILAVLLLVFGIAGVAGNLIAGRLIDRFGSRRIGSVAFGLQAIVLTVLPSAASSLVATGLLFAVWGVSANASLLPVQHRMIAIDPSTSGVALSWYSTALYTGIALAPPLGASALGLGNAQLIPLVGAIATLLGFVAFQLGWLPRRSRSTDALSVVPAAE